MRMKALLALLVLLWSGVAPASHIHSTKAEQTLEQMIGRSGLLERLTLNGQTTDSVSPPNQGRLIYDRTNQCWAISENGGAYGCLVSAGGTTSFTTGSVLFAGTTGELSQDNNQLSWDNNKDILQIGFLSDYTFTTDTLAPKGSDYSYEVGVIASYPTWNPPSTASGWTLTSIGGFPATAGSSDIGRILGGRFVTTHAGSGTLSTMTAILGGGNVNAGAGPVTNVIAMNMATANNSANTVTNMTGIQIDINKFSSGAVTTARGLWIRSGFQGVTGTKHSLYIEDTVAHNYIGGPLGLATTSPTNLLSLSGQAARTIWMERHTTANTAGNSLTLQASGATSGATDKAGGQLILAPGANTGTGRSTVAIKGYTVATASGTSDGTQVDRQVVGGFKALSDGVDAALVNVTVASNTVAAGVIRYAVEVFDGTNLQVEEGQAFYHVTNKAGTIANNEVNQTFQQALTSGTLAVDWTITAANPAVITINANSSLTPSAGYPRLVYSIDNLTSQAITIQ